MRSAVESSLYFKPGVTTETFWVGVFGFFPGAAFVSRKCLTRYIIDEKKALICSQRRRGIGSLAPHFSLSFRIPIRYHHAVVQRCIGFSLRDGFSYRFSIITISSAASTIS